MGALSAVVSLLQACAARLRRAAAAPVPDRAGPKAVQPGWGPPRAAPASRIVPAGAWRCVRSDFPKFVVGRVYQCVEGADGSWRIRPDGGGHWAPYWSDADQRFCYPAHQLDFEPIGPKTPLRRAA